MEKRHNKFLILIIILIAAAGVIFMSQKMHKDSNSYVPTVAEAEEESKETSEISPDGKMTLTKKEEKLENSVKYSLLITNEETDTKSVILTKIVPFGVKISIPANTFSPDNKYVFLKEDSTDQSNYVVFSVDQSPNSPTTLNPLIFSDLFNEKYDDYRITEATGWGGINLIVFNTDKIEGGVGPSFWFDLPSKSFIQLSNRFD